jgi:5'-methylthioadenosine phosphorylase
MDEELKIALIGGSGLAQLFSGVGENTKRHEGISTPFGAPSDAILETSMDGVSVFLLSRHGPGHVLNPSEVPYRANLFALKQLGCTHILATGAVGSLRDEFRPRDLVIPDQIIDKTRREGTFFDHAAVHVEFAEPFCPVLRRILIETANSQENSSHKTHGRGCYVCMEGPAFSTRAESLMHRVWGGDLIGMTAMPEAKLAREAEMPYAHVSLVTDYDSWRVKTSATEGEALLDEILGNLNAASENAMRLLRQAIKAMLQRREELAACPARQALKLAIWSDKSRIDENEVRRLGSLWLKYFDQPKG